MPSVNGVRGRLWGGKLQGLSVSGDFGHRAIGLGVPGSRHHLVEHMTATESSHQAYSRIA